MDFWTIFNIVGTIASIGGAGISIWQANNAQTAAKKAKEIKEQFIALRSSSDAAELQAFLRKAIKSMEKFGPASVPANLRGITPSKEAQDVQEFMAMLKQDRALFGKANPNIADQSCEKLGIALNEFAQSQNEADLRTNGSKLYIILMEISPSIKTLMDAKLEKVS
jgi:hypothetical protein